MLQTSYNQDLSFRVSDSTVYVNPGTIRAGNSILEFRGDSITFSQMVDFSTAIDKFQYSALMVHDLRDTTSSFAYPQADLTTARSAYTDSSLSLSYPIISRDSSAHVVGLFLFGNPDSTVTLYSSQKIIN